MPPIDDFVEHRFADAKEVLRGLDPEFVRSHETTVRLQNLNLWSPVNRDPSEPPRKKLSKKWHTLLEGCDELVWRVMILKESVSRLTAEAAQSMTEERAGAQSYFALRSWFVHMVALCEQVETVIRRTLKVYTDDLADRTRVSKKFVDQVHERVKKHVNEHRDQVAHGDRGSLSQGITEDGLWEAGVSMGQTPSLALKQFHLPSQGERAQTGQYDLFVDLTEYRCQELGEILFELEGELGITVR